MESGPALGPVPTKSYTAQLRQAKLPGISSRFLLEMQCPVASTQSRTNLSCPRWMFVQRLDTGNRLLITGHWFTENCIVVTPDIAACSLLRLLDHAGYKGLRREVQC